MSAERGTSCTESSTSERTLACFSPCMRPLERAALATVVAYPNDSITSGCAASDVAGGSPPSELH